MLIDADPVPPQRPDGRQFLLAGLLVAMLLALGTFAIVHEYRNTLDARAKLMRSYERRMLVADLLSWLKDAETAERGYLITGDERFFAPYRPAITAIARDRTALEAKLIQVPRQEARYAALSRAIDLKLNEMDAVLAVGAVRGAPTARASVGDEGRVTMDRARALGAAMVAEEDRMIADRVASDDRRVEWVQGELGILVAVLAGLAATTLIRELRVRRLRYRMESETQAAEIRLASVFAATSDAVALIDPYGRIETVNPAVMQLVGRAPKTLIGQDITVLTDAVPAGGAFSDRLGLINGQLSDPVRSDRVAHHADGHSVPVDVALGLMPVPSGLHVVAAIRDMSERKRADRIKDEFVATVSHELRTPLTSIVGALGLLQATADAAFPESGRRLLQVAGDNSRRLIDLINDLLDTEKMEAGQLRFRDQPLDLAAVLRQVAERSEALAAVHDVRIGLSIAAGAIMVRGDDGRLAQVTTNLLANAIRFSPAGQTVTIAAERRQGRAVVTVDDRGPGVPEAFRDQLFTRFAQSEVGGRAVGTGLGLAISRQIMRAHGGTIWFEPRAGGGARFGFALNLRVGGTETPHMLICTEDAAVGCDLRRLADAGACSADRVATVPDARAAIRSGTYDAVLIDLDGGDATGDALLASLSEDAVDGRLPMPVIARTGGAVWLGTGTDRAGWETCPTADGALAARVRALLDGIGATRPLIVHIDGDAAVIDRTAGALQRRGRLRVAPDLAAATVLLRRERPVLVILDQDMADGTTSQLSAWLATLNPQGGDVVATVLYSARPVTPALEAIVDCVVTKSQRSSANLIAAADRLLARAGVETAGVRPDGIDDAGEDAAAGDRTDGGGGAQVALPRTVAHAAGAGR